MTEYSGVVFGFEKSTGFGFVEDPDGNGNDVFVHVNELADAREKWMLEDGVEIEYEIVDGDRGPRAEQVRVIQTQTGTTDLTTELTERLIENVPSLTGEQIKNARETFIAIAVQHGWLRKPQE